jgi:hypothetical protein
MTIILHNSFATTPHHNDWTRDNDDYDSEDKDGDDDTLDDALIFIISEENEDNYGRNSVHNYLYHKLIS